jgi:hypothetical protein
MKSFDAFRDQVSPQNLNTALKSIFRLYYLRRGAQSSNGRAMIFVAYPYGCQGVLRQWRDGWWALALRMGDDGFAEPKMEMGEITLISHLLFGGGVIYSNIYCFGDER